jgi:hypothetical protein
MIATKRLMRLIFVPLLFCSSTIEARSLGETGEGLAVSFVAKRAQLTLHEPVVITFEVKNGTFVLT